MGLDIKVGENNYTKKSDWYYEHEDDEYRQISIPNIEKWLVNDIESITKKFSSSLAFDGVNHLLKKYKNNQKKSDYIKKTSMIL